MKSSDTWLEYTSEWVLSEEKDGGKEGYSQRQNEKSFAGLGDVAFKKVIKTLLSEVALLTFTKTLILSA